MNKHTRRLLMNFKKLRRSSISTNRKVLKDLKLLLTTDWILQKSSFEFVLYFKKILGLHKHT